MLPTRRCADLGAATSALDLVADNDLARKFYEREGSRRRSSRCIGDSPASRTSSGLAFACGPWALALRFYRFVRNNPVTSKVGDPPLGTVMRQVGLLPRQSPPQRAKYVPFRRAACKV